MVVSVPRSKQRPLLQATSSASRRKDRKNDCRAARRGSFFLLGDEPGPPKLGSPKFTPDQPYAPSWQIDELAYFPESATANILIFVGSRLSAPEIDRIDRGSVSSRVFFWHSFKRLVGDTAAKGASRRKNVDPVPVRPGSVAASVQVEGTGRTRSRRSCRRIGSAGSEWPSFELGGRCWQFSFRQWRSSNGARPPSQWSPDAMKRAHFFLVVRSHCRPQSSCSRR